MLELLLFDLDNTLYPASLPMEGEIVGRMNAFVAKFLGLGIDEAKKLREREAPRFGTTLEWLMSDRGLKDAEAYFAAIHPEDEVDCLEPSPELLGLLDSMPLPKAIFTNSPREHALRVLDRLGALDRFRAVYDIRFCGLRGKPRPSAFLRVCEAEGVAPARTLFIDDLPRYVRGFIEAGGRGLLIDESGSRAGSGLPSIRSLDELPPLINAELS